MNSLISTLTKTSRLTLRVKERGEVLIMMISPFSLLKNGKIRRVFFYGGDTIETLHGTLKSLEPSLFDQNGTSMNPDWRFQNADGGTLFYYYQTYSIHLPF